MRRGNKVFVIIVSFLIIGILSGCYPENFISSDVEGEKMAKKLLNYFSEDDADGLKSMFCDRAKESPELDRQIEEALIFFEGAVIAEPEHILVSGGEAMDRGRMTRISANPHITGIETDADKKYEIKFNCYLVYKQHEDIVGISQIVIYSSDGEKYVIGEFIPRIPSNE